MSYVPMEIQTRWRDKAHEDFYRYMLRDLEGAEGPYTKLIVYLLAAHPLTRKNFWAIYDNHSHCIKSGCWGAGWNTPESRLVIALAAMLSEDLSAPAASAETLAPCVVDALVWSDYIDSSVCGVSYA